MAEMKAQKTTFKSGNEAAVLAAAQINYHLMGYFPITPSTQIAEGLDAMVADGKATVKMVAADGEHGAAGVCYGASTGGGRVFNATSANGLLYSMEQLPVQSGTRVPMVMNVVTRTVSGPLDIKGDHSDIMYALNAGWIILMAKDAQEVYDMNVMALPIGEKEDVMLPVIIASDGFFTSHQKARMSIFEKNEDVQEFVGTYNPKYTSLDPTNPVTIGPYMNEPDLINNKYQLAQAMEKAYEYIPQVFEKFSKISGREYKMVDTYQTEDADVILFILNSAFATAKEAVDRLRAEGKKVGVVAPQVIRPWPAKEINEALKNAKVVVLADRQDSPGTKAGNMSIEVRATMHTYKNNADTLSRVYGLGGKDFYLEDAVEFLQLGLKKAAGEEIEQFDFFGHYPGVAAEECFKTEYFKPLTKEEQSPGILKVEKQEDGRLNIKGAMIKNLTKMPLRISSGHGACPGCGIFPNLNLLLKGIEGYVVMLFHTGCAMVVTTSYPTTSFKVTYIHNLFQNGAATLSGVVEMFHERKRRGELAEDLEITFVMVSGDGGMDIGMGPAIGAALRNHKMIIFEYDNGGYMNTGHQLSYTTPYGSGSSTSHVGKAQVGKGTFHKDTPMIFAGTHIPYIATVSESEPADFVKKAKKAQVYANEFGMAYVKALSACPLNWNSQPQIQRSVIQAAVDSCYHPLYEMEQGITTITYNPEKRNKKIPVTEFLKLMGRTKHLLKHPEVTERLQSEVDRRWERLKAMNDSPVL